MFTGIVQALGRVAQIGERAGDLRLQIDTADIDASRLAVGASVAVAGVCLTVAAIVPGGFVADVSRETLDFTTLGAWRQGQRVNLEPALRAGDALGGHLVSGHVDGLAQLVSSHSDARSQRLSWRAAPELMRFIATKGSVTLDGVSLTVNAVNTQEFTVNLIPHTLQVTTLGTLAVGARVNLEVDLIARYTARLLETAAGGAH